MKQKDAESFLKQAIPLINKHFYDNKGFKVFGMDVVPNIKIEAGHLPNGNLTPVGSGMGIMVSQGLLAVKDDTAVKFGLAHELGHAFCQAALKKIGLGAAEGCVTEVIADLGSAYVLSQCGSSWKQIGEATKNGVALKIFDHGWEGHHPPGKKRAECVNSLKSLIEGGESYAIAAKAICMSMEGQKAP